MAAGEFHLIDNRNKDVIIPWDRKGRELCERLRKVRSPVPREILRKLQRYTVNIPIRTWNDHVGDSIELVHDRYPVLISPEEQYDVCTGLSLEGPNGKAFIS